MSWRQQLWRWSPPFLWMAVIYFLSTDHLSFPGFRKNWMGFLIAKGVHLVEYIVLSLLWYRAIAGQLSLWNRTAALQAFVAASIYAVLDETHQSFTTERNGNLKDVLLDVFGAQLPVVALWLAHYRRGLSAKSLSLVASTSQKGNENAQTKVRSHRNVNEYNGQSQEST